MPEETDELLLTGEKRHKLARELWALVDATGYKGPTDAELAIWNTKEGGEDWLQIDFSEFEKGVEGEYAGGWGGNTEHEEKLGRMVERFESFLNDDKPRPARLSCTVKRN